MKIGIIFLLYGCEDYQDRCLSPWIKLRKELNLILTAANGMYRDLLNYGFKDRSHKSLIKVIGKDLDFLITTTGEHLWGENNSRNYLLNYLKDQDVDLIWIVDGDEFYTEEEIKNTIDFVSSNPDPDAYAMQFRNYTIKMPYWTEGFRRETIYWTRRNDGIMNFHFDVFIRYNNGKTITINDTKNCIKIPKKIAYIEHYSWLSNDPRTPEKVVYQNGRFFGEEGKKCAFEYDSENGLSFNKKFWDSRGLEVPILHETLGIHCTDFDLSLSRKNRVIDIFNVCEEGEYEFIVKSPEEEIIHHSVLSLSPGINYFIHPGNYPDFSFFHVIVYFNGHKIHDEKLHLEI